MPVYEYRCPRGHVTTDFRWMSDRNRPKSCACGLDAEKAIVTPPRVFADYEPYESPVTGRIVSGKKERERDLRASGCRPYEVGEKEQFLLRQAAEERVFDKTVDEVVDQTIAQINL